MRTDAETSAYMVEHKIRDLIALGPVEITGLSGVRMSFKGTIVSGDVYKFRKTPYCAGTVALSGRCKVVEHG